MDILLLTGLGPFLALVAMGILVMAFAMTGFILHEFIVCRLDRRRFERENPDFDRS